MSGMQAIRVGQYGGPEQLRYEEAPVPAVVGGHVLVRVRAASVNPFDYKLASGAFREFIPLTLPYVPGSDFSGEVEAVGPGVQGLKKGDEVYGNPPAGAFAQYVSVAADAVGLKPRKLSHGEAASVPVAGLTAWQALFDHGHLERGQRVLIHAAAGGVGTFAVQLAHWKGARVLATASAANAEYVQALGADQVIDYKKTPFEIVTRGVDVVLDLVGGDTQARSLKVLRAGGYLVSTVEKPAEEEAQKYRVHASMVLMKPSRQLLEQLAELLDAGAIRTVVSKTYPLAQAAAALAEVKAGHTRGKVVLEVP